jgi:hypothetical protein
LIIVPTVIASLLCLHQPAAAQDSDKLLSFTPTGDALTDKYLHALMDQTREEAAAWETAVGAMADYYGVPDRSGGFRALVARIEEAKTNGKVVPNPVPWAGKEKCWKDLHNMQARVPLALVRSWEGQFSSDPRYWQLLSFCANGKGSLDILVDAKRAGHADAVTLLALRKLYDYAADDYVERRLHKQAENHADYEKAVADAKADGREPPDEEGWTTHWTKADFQQTKREAKELVRRLGIPNELSLLDAAVAAAPNWAQMYYARAGYYWERADYAHALEDLQRGNAAPKNLEPWPFPVSALQEQMEQGGNVIAVRWGLANTDRFIWYSFDPFDAAYVTAESAPYLGTLPKEQRIAICKALILQNVRAMEVDRLDGFYINRNLEQLNRLMNIIDNLKGSHRLGDLVLEVRMLNSGKKAEREWLKEAPYDDVIFDPVTSAGYLDYLYADYSRFSEGIADDIDLRERVRPLLEDIAAWASRH